MCTSILHGKKPVLASGCSVLWGMSVWKRNWSKSFSANSFILLELQLRLPSAVLSPLNSFMERLNMKSFGNLILRLSKQIWHQTFCTAQAGSEADTFTVTLKWNALYCQIMVFVEEYLINGLPPHVFLSQHLIASWSMHLSMQLNVYLDIEWHILTWRQC